MTEPPTLPLRITRTLSIWDAVKRGRPTTRDVANAVGVRPEAVLPDLVYLAERRMVVKRGYRWEVRA